MVHCCSLSHTLALQISEGQDEHLKDLSQIRFLVIDEADRMLQQGSFQQLTDILEAVQRANPMEDDEDNDPNESDDEEEDEDRLLGLPGVRGEARLVMLTDDILQGIERQRNGEAPTIEEEEVVVDDVVEEESIDEDMLPARPPVHRQTFVYSATLTMTESGKPLESKKKHTKKGKKNEKLEPEGIIADLLEKAGSKGQTKVVDLSRSGNQVSVPAAAKEKNARKGQKSFRFPPGLSLYQIKCTQRHKDSYLYAYLRTTEEGASGPALVFCNSIACVRRVSETLQTLRLNVRVLHAKMQQVRTKYVEVC